MLADKERYWAEGMELGLFLRNGEADPASPGRGRELDEEG